MIVEFLVKSILSVSSASPTQIVPASVAMAHKSGTNESISNNLILLVISLSGK